MNKNRYHTDVERAQIVALHKIGLLNAKFRSKLVSTSHPFKDQLKKFISEGIYGNQKKSGRPRKTTARDDNTIKRIVSALSHKLLQKSVCKSPKKRY